MALATTLGASGSVWALYNGLISYCIMGLLFGVEYIIRKEINKKMFKSVALSQVKKDSRPLDTLMCYDNGGKDGARTWEDFLKDTAALRVFIRAKPQSKWILHAEDNWYFITCLTAIFQCGREPILSAAIGQGILDAFAAEDTAVLTDVQVAGKTVAPVYNIKDAISTSYDEKDFDNIPALNAKTTFVTLLTSGTTGKPKAVKLHMDGFETDNGFILQNWGENWFGRKVASTISPHHIFGFIFGCLVPFTGAIPFNRRRVETSEELFSLCQKQDTMIITVPAFLKRIAEEPNPPVDAIKAHSHYIYEAGGFLPPPVAKTMLDIFACKQHPACVVDIAHSICFIALNRFFPGNALH
jgi:acyl-coenzyme A synthetase/AMP-(fatty) acid ligase